MAYSLSPSRGCSANPECGETASAHARTWLRNGHRLTLTVAALPSAAELPGAAHGQIWMWTRPKGAHLVVLGLVPRQR